MSWYYYTKDGSICGPFPPAEFKALAERGIITPETRIQSSTGQESTAGKIKGLEFPSNDDPKKLETSLSGQSVVETSEFNSQFWKDEPKKSSARKREYIAALGKASSILDAANYIFAGLHIIPITVSVIGVLLSLSESSPTLTTQLWGLFLASSFIGAAIYICFPFPLIRLFCKWCLFRADQLIHEEASRRRLEVIP